MKVKLSKGEHYFTPDEVKTLQSKGVDLNVLAPNATTPLKDGGSYGDGTQTGGLTKEEIAKRILKGLGMKETSVNVQAIINWQNHESSSKKNNPLNTTLNTSKKTGKANSDGVAGYETIEDGIQATVDTLKEPRYKIIRQALENATDPKEIHSAINSTPWGTHNFTKDELAPTIERGGAKKIGNRWYNEDGSEITSKGDLKELNNPAWDEPDEQNQTNDVDSSNKQNTTLPKQTTTSKPPAFKSSIPIGTKSGSGYIFNGKYWEFQKGYQPSGNYDELPNEQLQKDLSRDYIQNPKNFTFAIPVGARNHEGDYIFDGKNWIKTSENSNTVSNKSDYVAEDEWQKHNTNEYINNPDAFYIDDKYFDNQKNKPIESTNNNPNNIPTGTRYNGNIWNGKRWISTIIPGASLDNGQKTITDKYLRDNPRSKLGIDRNQPANLNYAPDDIVNPPKQKDASVAEKKSIQDGVQPAYSDEPLSRNLNITLPEKSEDDKMAEAQAYVDAQDANNNDPKWKKQQQEIAAANEASRKEAEAKAAANKTPMAVKDSTNPNQTPSDFKQPTAQNPNGPKYDWTKNIDLGAGLSALQLGLGLSEQSKLGAAPVDTIPKDVNDAVEKFRKESEFGISPLERAIAEKNIENTRRNQIKNIVGQSGGNAGVALANMSEAGVNADDSYNNLALTSEKLRLAKLDNYAKYVYARQPMQRQLFEDKMDRFNKMEAADAGLIGSGVKNLIEGDRYQKAIKMQQDRDSIDKTPITGTTDFKPTKKSIRDAYGALPQGTTDEGTYYNTKLQAAKSPWATYDFNSLSEN